MIKNPFSHSGARLSLIGNSVKIGDRPAAVIGDESRNNATDDVCCREGAAGRTNRESEDLPEM